ncbi:hypothetical protein CF326_g94 [Tilletia indica]|nr:hypothetical protein CF326_g94 [Tilletia indica]
MSAAAAFTHYDSSARTVYRAILRELRKSAPPLATGPSVSYSSLKSAAGSATSSADLIASAQSKLAERSSPTSASSSPVESAATTTISRTTPPSFLQSPVLPFIRQSLRSAEAGTDSGVQGRTRLRDLADVELFMRSKRIHGDLLIRYNPTHGMSEQERVRATARRVGLDVPVEYDPSDSEQDAGAMAAATLEGDVQGQRQGYTGPLPPPKLDQD